MHPTIVIYTPDDRLPDLVRVDCSVGCQPHGQFFRAAVMIHGASGPNPGLQIMNPVGISLIAKIIEDIRNGNHIHAIPSAVEEIAANVPPGTHVFRPDGSSANLTAEEEAAVKEALKAMPECSLDVRRN